MDDSLVEIVAFGEVPDQEDEYDTDSGSKMDDAIFALIFALTCRVCTIGRGHIHFLVNDSVMRS